MNLLTIPFALIVKVLHGGHLYFAYGVLWIQLTDDYVGKNVIGRTLGHVVILGRLGNTLTCKLHELTHVIQLEAAGLVGWMYGMYSLATGAHWSTALAQFVLAPVMFYLSASLVGIIRGKDKYRGNFLEEAAFDHEDH